MAALALAVASAAQPPAGDDRLARVRDALRIWYAAERAGEPAGLDGLAEQHRLRVLRLWPAHAAGDAWLRDADLLRRLFAGCFAYGAFEPAMFAELAGVEVQVPPGYDPATPWPTTVEVRPRLRDERRAGRGPAGGGIVVRTTPGRLQALLRPPRRTSLGQFGLALARLLAATPAHSLALALATAGQGPLDDEVVQRGLFFTIGVIQRRLNVDRDRLYLEGAGAACDTVLRAATAAPDRFAAVVLRSPSAPPSAPCDNLAGIPVLVLAAGPGDGAAAALRRAIGAVDGGSVEVRSDRGFEDGQLRSWLRQRVRRLMRERVTLVMRADAAVDGYWVSGISADLGTSPFDDPARIEVVADRGRGRITVNAWRIERFSLLLNDELIDLDREFTLVVNGERVTMRRTRSLSFLTQTVADRFDPGFLFTTALAVDVPRRG